MFHIPNGKDMVQVPMEYTFMVYILYGKGMVLSKIVFRSGNRHGTDRKVHHK